METLLLKAGVSLNRKQVNEMGMFDEMMMVTLAGLRVTAIEKICASGFKESKDDTEKIRDVYCEIVRFWKLDKKLIDEFENRMGQLEKMDKEGL